MLGIRYDSKIARVTAAEIARRMRDAAYRASTVLVQEKGTFPLFDPERFVGSPFIQRLPKGLQEAVCRHGLRNSQLLSMAPTGTISLAFADNVSNGIEPAHAWEHERKSRLSGDAARAYSVQDHSYRLYRAQFGVKTPLRETFVSALEIGVREHIAMVAAVAPYIDSSISKTVNVPVDYPYSQFKNLYLDAWRLGLKALSTFRESRERESVLRARTGSGFEDTSRGLPCPQCGAPRLRMIDGCRHCGACGFDEDCG
jgi:ribonucleoside-diphosphate reductase alpha chain